MSLRRALHFVFKVGDRGKTATFYRDVLGMKVRYFAVLHVLHQNSAGLPGVSRLG